MKVLFTTLICIFMLKISAQETDLKLPYHEIPEAPQEYNAGSVSARMIDGLGFRYYWATEGLTQNDLDYRPSESGRTSAETIDHIYGLSAFILATINQKPRQDMSFNNFEAKRKQTLLNFKEASDILRASNDVSQFKAGKYPFWNLINGPIADALWHCGQVVMLRRASGNPFNSKVSVFQGKLRE